MRDPLLVVLAPISDDLRGRRDRSLILVGWAAALRRSELAALEIRDFVFVCEGAVVAIRRSKRDQEGEGEEVAIAFAAEPHAMCGARVASVARRGRARRGKCLSEHRPPRHDRREPLAVGDRRDREGARGGYGASRQFRGALAALGLRDFRCTRRFRRGSDYEAWPLEKRCGYQALHPRRQPLRRERQNNLTRTPQIEEFSNPSKYRVRNGIYDCAVRHSTFRSDALTRPSRAARTDRE